MKTPHPYVPVLESLGFQHLNITPTMLPGPDTWNHYIAGDVRVTFGTYPDGRPSGPYFMSKGTLNAAGVGEARLRADALRFTKLDAANARGEQGSHWFDVLLDGVLFQTTLATTEAEAMAYVRKRVSSVVRDGHQAACRGVVRQRCPSWQPYRCERSSGMNETPLDNLRNYRFQALNFGRAMNSLKPGRRIRWRTLCAEYGLQEALIVKSGGFPELVVRDVATGRTCEIYYDQLAELFLTKEEASVFGVGWPS